MSEERFEFRSWDGALVRFVKTSWGEWVQYPGTVPLSSPCPWTLEPIPSCSICRADHGSEVVHACE